MHVHLSLSQNTKRKIFDQDAIENCEATLPVFVLILMLNWLKWMGNDHVHLLINYPPKLAISNLVNSLKGVSSRLLRRDRPDIAQRDYYQGGSLVAELFHGEL